MRPADAARVYIFERSEICRRSLACGSLLRGTRGRASAASKAPRADSSSVLFSSSTQAAACVKEADSEIFAQAEMPVKFQLSGVASGIHSSWRGQSAARGRQRDRVVARQDLGV